MNDTGNRTGKKEVASVISASAMHQFRKPLVDYLISGLEVDDKWVRILAADMLGNAGDPRATESLKRLLVDRDQDLREVSLRAMDMIAARQETIIRSQPDRCAGCMIRLIAEEALAQRKPPE